MLRAFQYTAAHEERCCFQTSACNNVFLERDSFCWRKVLFPNLCLGTISFEPGAVSKHLFGTVFFEEQCRSKPLLETVSLGEKCCFQILLGTIFWRQMLFANLCLEQFFLKRMCFFKRSAVSKTSAWNNFLRDRCCFQTSAWDSFFGREVPFPNLWLGQFHCLLLVLSCLHRRQRLPRLGAGLGHSPGPRLHEARPPRTANGSQGLPPEQPKPAKLGPNSVNEGRQLAPWTAGQSLQLKCPPLLHGLCPTCSQNGIWGRILPAQSALLYVVPRQLVGFT